MKFKSKLIKGSLILCVLGGLAVGLIFWHGDSNKGKEAKGLGGISLVKPAFAQTAQISTFPAETAGICTYVNTGNSINLEKIKYSQIFKRIEERGQDYLIGVVNIEGLWTKAFPYVYVNSDGWIVSYYPINVSSTMIMNWVNYEGEAVIETTLHNAIAKVLSELELSPQEIGYYHFGYPEATKIFLGIKYVEKGEEEEFSYTIPSGVKIYESSYSANAHSNYEMDVYIDGTEDFRIRGYSKENGFIPEEYLTPVLQHTVKVEDGQFALAFVYGAS